MSPPAEVTSLYYRLGAVCKSGFYPKIKNIVLSSTNKGSKADYQKLKKDIESAVERDDEALAMLSHQIGDPDPSDFHTKIWMMEGLERLRGRVKFYRYEMNNFKEEEAFHTTYDVLSKL